jgi:Cu(I)/Ag(I) efflux system membrane fusion protein
MTAYLAIKVAALALAGTGLAYGGYWAGLHRTGSQAERTADAGARTDPKTGRSVLYWHDPMVPGQKFDKPGKSPFMDMQLAPVYADDGSAEGGVKISPTLQQNLGMRFATVRRAETRASFALVGSTQFDESIAEVVQSRVTGYIDRLYARAPMQRIRRGEALASLYVPEWIAPQEEYLALRRLGNDTLAVAARQRMRALSIPPGLIAQAERTGQAQNHLTLTSPVNGVITELPVRDGAMVSPGMTIAKVAGLNKLWLLAEVPEALVNSVWPGMSVDAASSAEPNRQYAGRVREILPGVSAVTRTVQARLELDNRDGSLTPGMLMRVILHAEKPVSRLLVPTEAVIATGKRSVVLVAADDNSMQPVTVTTGGDFGDDTEILSGVSEGQKVVTSGQFLIDSEASLKAVLPRLSGPAPSPSGPAPAPAAIAAAPVYHGVGKVEKVSTQSMTLSHKPIAQLQWPAMTMEFGKARADAYADIKVGQDVEFSFRQGPDGYVLEDVRPASGSRK